MLHPVGAPVHRADPAQRLANRLVEDSGIAEDCGVLYRENLAAHIYHALDASSIRSLAQSPQKVTLQTLRSAQSRWPAARWMTKIERDIAAPYQDAAVFVRVRQLDCKLQEEMTQLARWAGDRRVQVVLNGSVCKGRMGKNSDVDVMLQTDPAVRDALVEWMRSRPNDDVSYFAMPSDRGIRYTKACLFGPKLDLGNCGEGAYPGILFKHYVADLERRGFKVQPDLSVSRETPVARAREVHVGVEKFLELSRPGQGSRALGWVADVSFAAIGRMVQWPVLGAALRGGLERLAPTRLMGPAGAVPPPARCSPG